MSEDFTPDSSPDLAVVVAAYNSELTLARTLESIPANNIREVLVVNDGSTDDTASIARSFEANKKVRLISQDNAGPSAARNAGVAATDTDWIAFLDSDDLWFDWTPSCIAKAIAAHPAALFGLLQPLEFSDKLPKTSAVDGDFSAVIYDPAIRAFATGQDMPFPGAGALVIRRDVFNRLGGFTRECRFGEDLDLILRAAAEGSMWIVEQPLGFAYRRQPGSLVGDHDAAYKGMMYLLENHADVKDELFEAAIGNFVRPVVVSQARAGKFGNALSLYRRLVRPSVRQGRLKFLLGVPPLSLAGKLRHLFASEND